MSLANQIVYVAGGCGIVGSGIVRNLINNGAKVWVTSRSQKNLDDLEKTVELPAHKANLVLHQANVFDEVECVKVREEILRKDGKVNHCVASLGSFWSKGTLSKQPAEEFSKVFNDMVVSHFSVYKTFAPELAKQANANNKTSYTFITGGLGEACVLPNSSLITVFASAQYGLYQSALAEFKKQKDFKLNEIRFYMWIRNRLDKEFDQQKSQMEVGNDWTGNVVGKILQSSKSGQFKLLNRKKGDELLSTL